MALFQFKCGEMNMNSKMMFDFEGYAVGVVEDAGGQVWFKAGDLCRLAGFSSKPRRILKWQIDRNCIHWFDVTDARGRTRVKAHVNVQGMTILTTLSPNPRAYRLRKWILSCVLPSLSKRAKRV